MRKPEPRNGFTVGIIDDVSHTSLTPDTDFRIEPNDVVQAVFYGLGADGTVGANKNSVKIIAEDAGLYAQGYFVYDSHKSGAQTVSHLRFGPQPIHAPYLIQQASFIGCHQFQFIARQDVLRLAAPGATVLLNTPYGPGRGVGPSAARDAACASSNRSCGCSSSMRRAWRRRWGCAGAPTPCCRPASSRSPACCRATRRSRHIKQAIRKTYGGKGEAVVQANFRAVDDTLARLFEVTVPAAATSRWERPAAGAGACARRSCAR